MEMQKQYNLPEPKPSFIELNLLLETVSEFMNKPNQQEIIIFNAIFEELIHSKLNFLPSQDIINLIYKKGSNKLRINLNGLI